jgi:hypothetical protein
MSIANMQQIVNQLLKKVVDLLAKCRIWDFSGLITKICHRGWKVDTFNLPTKKIS